MRISIVGTGYVGLCSGIGFALKSSEVICVDRSSEKVAKINAGEPPIFEAGLREAMEKVVGKTLRATSDLPDAIRNSDITFIAVGTPSLDDGSIDLSQVRGASQQIAEALAAKKDYHVVVMKSTVLPGTTEDILISELAKRKKLGEEVGVAMNPEFLREGSALDDFMRPDRIVIGEYDRRSGDSVASAYSGFDAPVMRTSLRAAEMIKYASNSLLAAKISFANEIGNVCKKLGIDTYEVMRGAGMDKRIGPHFLAAGAGFGGSCFPKDVAALIAKAQSLDIEPRMLRSVMDVNDRQKTLLVEMLRARIGSLAGKRVALLGLAFKAGTDDVRDSVALSVIAQLLKEGALIAAYDPMAEENMKQVYPDITYCSTIAESLDGADACLILTEWEEFRGLADKDFGVMRNKLIIEGRKVLDKNKVAGFEGICW